MSNIPSLTELERSIWQELVDASCEPGHYFRTPVFATTTPDDVGARKVILRATDRVSRELVLFSDVRSRKVAQLAIHPLAEWVFYDPERLIQVTARGTTSISDSPALRQACWESLSSEARYDYAAVQPPGSPIDSPKAVQYEAEPKAFERFVVIKTSVSRLEWLRIDPAGHHRAEFVYREEGGPHCSWLVP